MRNDILKLQRKLGLTTIFVTHDQEEANTISDRMAVLDKGVIQQIGSPMDLYDYPVNQFVAHFLGTTNLIEGEVSQKDGQAFLQAGSDLLIPINTSMTAGQGSVVFRPQSVLINPETQLRDIVAFNGRVGTKEFIGATIRYSIEVGKNKLLVEQDHQRGKPVLAENSKVRLVIPKKQILFIEN